MEATHTDRFGTPTAFSPGVDTEWEDTEGTRIVGWPFYPTPCCGAAASIDDGPMYCKKCHGEVSDLYGGMPEAPFTPIGSQDDESARVHGGPTRGASMGFTRSDATAIGAEAKEALEEVAARHGLELEWKGVTYDTGMVRPRCELRSADAAASEFNRYAGRYGLSPDDFGAEFTSGGRTFRIAGVSPRSPKRPILCDEVGTGNKFKFTAEGVKAGLGS